MTRPTPSGIRGRKRPHTHTCGLAQAQAQSENRSSARGRQRRLWGWSGHLTLSNASESAWRPEVCVEVTIVIVQTSLTLQLHGHDATPHLVDSHAHLANRQVLLLHTLRLVVVDKVVREGLIVGATAV